MKKIRKNILKLFLFVCLGLSLTTIVFASARIVGDVPSAPGQPEVVDIWMGGCELRYSSPAYNGGAPILNYVIEYRYKYYSSWETHGTTTITYYMVYDMMEGREAEFRVSAVNKFGRSNPSKPSEFIKFY